LIGVIYIYTTASSSSSSSSEHAPMQWFLNAATRPFRSRIDVDGRSPDCIVIHLLNVPLRFWWQWWCSGGAWLTSQQAVKGQQQLLGRSADFAALHSVVKMVQIFWFNCSKGFERTVGS
jgi:hypothetical protein